MWLPATACTVFAANATSGGGGPQGGSNTGGFQQASVTTSVFAFAGDQLAIYCYSAGGNAASNIFDSGITAVLIDQAFDAAKKASSGKHAAHIPSAPIDSPQVGR